MQLATLAAYPLAIYALLAPRVLDSQINVGERPEFQQYPTTVYKGKIVMPAFKRSKPDEFLRPDGDHRCVGADEEQRRLFFGKRKPNFAGQWTVYSCTCGTGCGSPFMWNGRTGEVYRDFPFAYVSVGPPSTGWRGLVHTAESRLLVVEGSIDGEFRGTCYYLCDGQRFALLLRIPFPSPKR